MDSEYVYQIRKIIGRLDMGATNFTECYNELMDVMNDMEKQDVVLLFAKAVEEEGKKVRSDLND